MLPRITPFRKKAIEEALQAHADSLVGMLDEGDSTRPRSRRRANTLDGLYRVADGVRDALTPVDPEDSFVADLRSRLSETFGERVAQRLRRRESRRLALQIAGYVGLMLSGLAMLALGVRFIISLLSSRRASSMSS